MGSTNHTSNYELSQFLGSDKPAWLLDYNGDMLKIDTQMKANADAASAAQSKADTADGKADDLRTDLTTLNNQVNDPTGLAADVATLSGTMNTVTSLIGNGEPTTTDKTLIGAINELDAGKADDSTIGDISTLHTEDKSTVVGAINELHDDISWKNATDWADAIANAQHEIMVFIRNEIGGQHWEDSYIIPADPVSSLQRMRHFGACRVDTNMAVTYAIYIQVFQDPTLGVIPQLYEYNGNDVTSDATVEYMYR